MPVSGIIIPITDLLTSMQYNLTKYAKTELGGVTMEDNRLYNNRLDDCPLTFALNLIGGKWRLPILWALSKKPAIRYNELKKNIDGITNMMLAQSLKELEHYGIVNRKQYAEIPPRVEYSLTDNGRDLISALKVLANWGKNMKRSVGY
jgi:DNA-binding HxlR family transcriptional regulator